MWHASLFSSSSTLLSFFFYFFLLSTPHGKCFTMGATISVDIINQTCETCADKSLIFSYDFCLTSLQEIPVSHSTNLQGLAVIAMELALGNVTSTISTIKELSSGTLDTFDLACLEDCLELYSNGVVTLVDAIEAFFMGQYSTANRWVSAVMEAATTCEGGFREKEGEVSPLNKENYNLFQLSDIALCIIDLLSLPLHS